MFAVDVTSRVEARLPISQCESRMHKLSGVW